MPQEGQRSITIKESIYDKIQKEAIQQHRTVANMAEFIFEKFLESKK